MASHYAIKETSFGIGNMIPPAIVGCCIFFNFFLCFINTKITGISVPVIILCEIMLIACSMFAGFFQLDRLKKYWLIILCLQIALICLLSILRQDIMMKPLRDIMIMPVFIILGLSAYRIEFSKVLLGFGVVVLVVALWEAFFTDSFLSLFNIRDYYIAKGAMADDVNITELPLFASGERPGGRFLIDIAGMHRISSVFMEPVSLGFFAAIMGIYFIAAKDSLSRSEYVAGLAISFLLIWLSDARMAFGVLFLTLVFRSVFLRINPIFALFLLPCVLLLSVALSMTNIMDVNGEGLGARLLWTLQILGNTNPEILMGVAGYGKKFVADSGLAYILNDQGLLGVLLYWLPPFLFLRHVPPPARVFIFGIAIYLAFGMMISQAFLTIKTAALLWFSYGYLISRNVRNGDPVPC